MTTITAVKPSKAELLRKAGTCFRAAQMIDDACRCFANAGEHAQSAPLFEEIGAFREAAEAFRRIGAWGDAARCFRAGDDPDPEAAAECLIRDDRPLEAAWVLAHEAHHYGRARTMADQIETDAPGGQLGVELIIARCEAATGGDRRAATRLSRVVEGLRESSSLPERPMIETWSLAVADYLRRWDLAALTHAAAVAAGSLDAASRWETWALETLGDASGVPEEGPHG